LTGAALHLIPYAFVASASPLALAATLTVLRTGRMQALGFAVGVVGGQLVACEVLVLIGTASFGHRAKAPSAEGGFELMLGTALLGLALLVHRRPERVRPDSGRSQRILDRLEHVRALTAVVAGLVLGIGGPAASITAAEANGAGRDAALVVWYGLLATAIVWVPVLAAIVLGQRGLDLLNGGFRWLTEHQRPVTVWVLLIVGTLLVADGIALVTGV
jgi:hypothetical protein